MDDGVSADVGVVTTTDAVVQREGVGVPLNESVVERVVHAVGLIIVGDGECEAVVERQAEMVGEGERLVVVLPHDEGVSEPQGDGEREGALETEGEIEAEVAAEHEANATTEEMVILPEEPESDAADQPAVPEEGSVPEAMEVT